MAFEPSPTSVDAPVALGTPQALGPPLAPSLTAGIGFELEIASAKLHPFVPKKTVLVEGHGWKLETDKRPNRDIADLEFVTEPMSDLADVGQAMDGIVAFIECLRSRATDSASRLVGLGDLDRSVRWFKVRDPFRGHWVEVKSLHFLCRMQVTYGIGLAQVVDHFDRYLPTPVAMALHVATHQVESLHRRSTGAPLSPEARGFVHLANYYVSRIVPREPHLSTVHVYFCHHMRSDFCAVYEKLLGPSDRRVIANLFTAPSGRSLPPFMEAQGMPPEQPVFNGMYFDQKYRKVQGPLVKDWLASILHGRGRGPLKKDLMSPPPGYRLHTRNADANYGGGGMGVDEVHQLALFEIRSAAHRDDMPLNRQMKRLVLREFMHGQRYNPRLRGEGFAPAPEADSRHDLLCAYEAALLRLVALKNAVGRYTRRPDQDGRTNIFEGPLLRLQASLKDLADTAEVDGQRIAELDAQIALLMPWVDAVASAGAQGAGPLPVASVAHERVLSNLERELWGLENAF
jgi:hypothetical protein